MAYFATAMLWPSWPCCLCAAAHSAGDDQRPRSDSEASRPTSPTWRRKPGGQERLPAAGTTQWADGRFEAQVADGAVAPGQLAKWTPAVPEARRQAAACR